MINIRVTSTGVVAAAVITIMLTGACSSSVEGMSSSPTSAGPGSTLASSGGTPPPSGSTDPSSSAVVTGPAVSAALFLSTTEMGRTRRSVTRRNDGGEGARSTAGPKLGRLGFGVAFKTGVHRAPNGSGFGARLCDDATIFSAVPVGLTGGSKPDLTYFQIDTTIVRRGGRMAWAISLTPLFANALNSVNTRRATAMCRHVAQS